MRLPTLAAVAALALLPIAPPAPAASIVVDYFDSAGTEVPAGFGSSAGVALSYAVLTGIGNSPVAPLGSARLWPTGYGDLPGAIWSGGSGSVAVTDLVLQISFAVDPGLTLTIESSRLGGYYRNQPTALRLYGPSYGLLYDSGAVIAPQTGSLLVAPNVTRDGSIILQLGPDSYNAGLNFLTYSVTTTRTPPPTGAIPEPGSLMLLAAGLSLFGVSTARRRVTPPPG